MITMPKLKIKRDSIEQKNLQPRDVILNSEKNINFNVLRIFHWYWDKTFCT